MPMVVPKPVELVEPPLDGQIQAQRVPAASGVTFRAGEIVKLVSGTATKLAGTETTGFYLVVKDNTPGLPAGSSVDLGYAGWFAKDPGYVDVVPVSGKYVIMTAQGTLAAANIGQQFGLTTGTDGITRLNLSNTTNLAGRLEQVVEGQVGDQNARVLVKLN